MSASKLQKAGVAAAIGLAAVFGASTSAMALDLGCQSSDLVKTQMAAEQQFALVSGTSSSTDHAKVIFTSNERGSMGYLLEQNEPDKICVGAKYTDIKVNNSSDFERPSWANIGTNSDYDKWLTKHEATGEKVLLGATTIIHHADTNTDTKGSFMIVSVGAVPDGIKNPGIKNTAAAQLVNRSGAGGSLAVMVNAGTVEPNYQKFASRTTELAAR